MNRFSDNLPRLRREAGYTQESLAEAMGVSRQAVSKWESGLAMPEGATLVDLADLLGCSLDRLVREELEQAVSTGLEEGEGRALYGAWCTLMDGFARGIANGVFLILFGLGLFSLLTTAGVPEWFTLLLFFAFLIAAVVCFISQGMARDDFVKAHPTMPDCCPQGEREDFRLRFRRAMVRAIGGVLAVVAVFAALSALWEEGARQEYLGALFFMGLAVCVRSLVYWGCLEEKYDLSKYNDRGDPVTGAICAAIMLAAAGVFLCVGFLREAWHPGWVAFVVGGILCGIVSVLRGKK